MAVSLKMYLDPAQTLLWCRKVAEMAKIHRALSECRAELVVFPAFPSLETAVRTLSGTPVLVGAQDLFFEDRGPYTGGVSGADLRLIGCRYVEIGHSERRRIFAEDDAIIARKMRAAWRNDLVPLLCVGERSRVSPQRAAAYCEQQLVAAVGDQALVDDWHPLAVAYEPEWSIGTSRPAAPDHIAEVTEALRDVLSSYPGLRHSRVIYGGSAGVGLSARLGSRVDGVFLGRFAHDPMALKAVLDESILVT